MNYSVLINELSTDPLSVGYSSMTDEQRFFSLIGLTRTKSRTVPIGEFSQWLTVSGIRFKLKAGERNSQLPDIVKDYIDVVFGVERNPHISVVDPAAATMIINGLLNAGVVNNDDMAATTALFTTPTNRVDELGLKGLGIGHLKSAREQMEAN